MAKQDVNMIGRTILLLGYLTLAYSEHAVIDTTLGRVRGAVREINGKPHTAFLGVPYAAPPVGQLRFAPAQKHDGWGDTIRDALELAPACPQDPNVVWEDVVFPTRLMKYPQDEDCLHLNIYVPGDMSRDEVRSLPVIVFIHGGGFVIGSSRIELGEVFVTDAVPVVMVTIQYRLTVLGFMTSGDDVISGNNGLKDQSFALRWVQQNIAAFGGDADQVTICGESAGGESILAHMVSPMSAGLFHRASAQSPPASWIYPTPDTLAPHFLQYLQQVNCAGTSEQYLKCLRSKPWQELLNVTGLRFLSQRVIDGEFMPDEQRHLWASGQYNGAELMVGFTSDDGKLMLDYILGDNNDFPTNRSNDLQLLNIAVDFMLKLCLADEKDWNLGAVKRYGQYLLNRDDLFTVIKARYYDTQKSASEKARGILDMTRDSFFMAFTLWTAGIVARHEGRVYVYVFDHPTGMLELDNPGGVWLGAPHASELPYQFGYGLTDPNTVRMSHDELVLTHSVIQAWTSFAAGDASYLTMNGDTMQWPAFTADENRMLYFDTNMTADSARRGDEWLDAMHFWRAVDALAVWGDRDDSIEDGEKADKDEL